MFISIWHQMEFDSGLLFRFLFFSSFYANAINHNLCNVVEFQSIFVRFFTWFDFDAWLNLSHSICLSCVHCGSKWNNCTNGSAVVFNLSTNWNPHRETGQIQAPKQIQTLALRLHAILAHLKPYKSFVCNIEKTTMCDCIAIRRPLSNRV